ncbi:hypothetical protein [Aestuariimicrobium ganziense]|uniref:hypothetical protein n=1 Tax=Aestuariimicrobium ganziense TaxID=2773677 RepID=UPI0019459906|nr:hypothetical protein [Aestuariimicrobium ganziense]
MSEDTDWVGSLLAGQSTPPPIPEAVAARIEAALHDEVARRQYGLAAEEARRALEELQRRSSAGSFGNAPTHLDKSGLGLSDTTPADC